MELRKRSIACFIGGCPGTAIALIFAPLFWWLGLLAGSIVAYLLYDLKEMWQKIPEAFYDLKEAWQKFPQARHKFLVILEANRRGLIKTCWLLIGYLLMFLTGTLLTGFLLNDKVAGLLVTIAWFGPCLFGGFFFYKIGRCAWDSKFDPELASACLKDWEWGPEISEDYSFKDFASFAMKTVPLTLLGVIVFPFLILILFCGILCSILWGCLKGAWRLFILIHSKERILCAIDCAMGIICAYFFLAPFAPTLAAKLMVVVSGGIIAVGFGAFNYEVVSVRWLKLKPAK